MFSWVVGCVWLVSRVRLFLDTMQAWSMSRYLAIPENARGSVLQPATSQVYGCETGHSVAETWAAHSTCQWHRPTAHLPGDPEILKQSQLRMIPGRVPTDTALNNSPNTTWLTFLVWYRRRLPIWGLHFGPQGPSGFKAV